MISLIKRAFCFAPFLFCTIGNAQIDDLEFSKPPSGISNRWTNSIHQDSRGFIWFATKKGLNVFDGYEFRNYLTDVSEDTVISSNQIKKIQQVKPYELLLLISGDLFSFSIIDNQIQKISLVSKLGKFTKYRDDPIRIRDFLVDEQKRVWVSAWSESSQDVLLQFDETFELVKYWQSSFSDDDSSVLPYRANMIVEGRENQIWLLGEKNIAKKRTSAVLLYREDTNDFAFFNTNNSILPDDRLQFIHAGRQTNQIWLGYRNKGAKLLKVKSSGQFSDLSSFSIVGEGSDGTEISNYSANKIFEDSNGRLWIDTNGLNGVSVEDLVSGRKRRYSYSKKNLDGISGISAECFFEDDNQSIWLGIKSGGINVIHHYNDKFKRIANNLRDDNSLIDNSVRTFVEGMDEVLWIGTQYGVSKYDKGTSSFENFDENTDAPWNLPRSDIASMCEDVNGNIYIGAWGGGLSKVTERGIVPIYPEGQFGRLGSVTSLVPRRDGTIWVTWNRNVYVFNPETNAFQNIEIEEEIYTYRSFLEDQKGSIWLGTDKGLFKVRLDQNLNTTEFIRYNFDDKKSRIKGKAVRDIYEDQNGNVWVATSEALNKYDPSADQFRPYTRADGLPENDIQSIVSDESGDIWVTTSSTGLARLDIGSDQFEIFGEKDGFSVNEFFRGASFRDSEGKLYFGSFDGVFVYDESGFRKNFKAPEVFLTEMKVLNDDVASDSSRYISFPIYDQTSIKLNYIQARFFSFSFVGLGYVNSEENRYEYQLEGFDDDWIDLGTERNVNLTNIAAGEYTLKVRASNNHGVWGNQYASFEIVVMPPWWETWWFRTLLTLSIAAFLLLFMKRRADNEKLQKEELRRKVEDATMEAYAKNESLHEEASRLTEAIEETNEVIKEAVESGNFSARINLENKLGQWKELAISINSLFDSITEPFTNIQELIGKMASGDLTERYEEEAKGDILKLVTSLNYALDNLSLILSTVKQNSNEIGISSLEMMGSSEEMDLGVAEIASSMGELSNGAQEQVYRIDHASNALENIMEFASKVADQATSIDQASKKGVSLSSTGEKEMTVMDASMKRMEEMSKDTSKSIDVLIDKSAEISGILGSMKEISVETNMLALNAAIEAAKAGDAGRGFAVVAEQIRKLAENSNSFALNIETIVEDVQASVQETSDAIKEMNRNIADGVVASSKASETFAELSTSYAGTLKLSGEIVSFTDQQLNKVKEITQVIESVVVIAEQAAAGTEQVASSSNELSAGMKEYKEKTSRVSTIVEELNQKMDEFKLNSADQSID